MAVTLKRKRGAVSYKEPSSEEDFSESSGQERAARRKKRAAPSRRSTRHRQQDDDGDDDASSQHASPEALPARKPQNASRASRSRGSRRISYKDISSDEDEEDPDADFEEDPDANFEAGGFRAPRLKPQATAVRSPRSPQSSNSKGKPRRKLVLGAPLKPNSTIHAERKAAEIPTDGHKPVCISAIEALSAGVLDDFGCNAAMRLRSYVKCLARFKLPITRFSPRWMQCADALLFPLGMGILTIPCAPSDLCLRLTPVPRREYETHPFNKLACAGR